MGMLLCMLFLTACCGRPNADFERCPGVGNKDVSEFSSEKNLLARQISVPSSKHLEKSTVKNETLALLTSNYQELDDSCDDFLENNKLVFGDEHEPTSEPDVSFAFDMMVSAALPSAAAFPVAMLNGMITPDPQEERITNLENGVSCLMKTVNVLQEDVKELEERVGLLEDFHGQGMALPLQKIGILLDSRAEDHVQCAKLMKCVADITLLNDDRFSASSCEQYMLGRYNMTHKVDDCNAAAFQKKFKDNDAFARDLHEMINLPTMIQAILKDSRESYYKHVKKALAEYAAVITQFFLAWNAMEEWAGAICFPYGHAADISASPCTMSDADDITRGILDFEKEYKNTLLTSWGTFLDTMQEEDFKEQRKQSAETIEKHILEVCEPYTFMLHQYDRACSGGFDSQGRHSDGHQNETKLNCSRVDLIVPNPLPISGFFTREELNFKLGCSIKECKETNCRCEYGNYWCSTDWGEPVDCGINWAECDENLTFLLKYDRIENMLQTLKDSVHELIEKREPTKAPPYHLPEGSTYPLMYDFRH